jgi:anaerobic selenocysteine-containing dehydrogenase
VALKATLALRPELKRYLPIVLHETLGAALPDDAKGAAVLWGACQFFVRKHAAAVRRAGIEGTGSGLGEALFERILGSPSGTAISTHSQEEMWGWLRHPDGRINLEIAEMFEEIDALDDEAGTDPDFPFILMAGERRSFNANTIIREPAWRRRDEAGSLKVNSTDAERLGLSDGQVAICESSRGAAQVQVEISKEVQPGVVSMPHGYGMVEGGQASGPAVNELTSSGHCDELAKTPFHKTVPVRIRPIPQA